MIDIACQGGRVRFGGYGGGVAQIPSDTEITETSSTSDCLKRSFHYAEIISRIHRRNQSLSGGVAVLANESARNGSSGILARALGATTAEGPGFVLCP